MARLGASACERRWRARDLDSDNETVPAAGVTTHDPSTRKLVLKAADIDALEGKSKVHFLNPNARRLNKSLGDLTGLRGIGFHLIEVPPGCESTEYHLHRHEDGCTYVLSGTGEVRIGDETTPIGPGDFIGYPAGGPAHVMRNTGAEALRCIVVGQRLEHDVGDYPEKGRRIFRSVGLPWQVVHHKDITSPGGGAGEK